MNRYSSRRSGSIIDYKTLNRDGFKDTSNSQSQNCQVLSDNK